MRVKVTAERWELRTPLRISRGVQNKFLEAMAMAKPVIATPQALEGIEAVRGKEVIVAEDDETLVVQAAEMLTSGERDTIGRQARVRVVNDYGWTPKLARLEAVLEG